MGSENRLPSEYLKPTVTIPPGTYYYKLNRRLPSTTANPLSKYPGLPIFHLYKQIRSSGTTVETRADSNEYWQPITSLPYVTYNTNDENTLVTFEDLSKSLIAINPNQKKSTLDVEPFFHAYYGGKVFIATTKFADVFGDQNQKNNPYAYRYLRLWILNPEETNYSYIDELGDTRVSYFYAVPVKKSVGTQYSFQFYPIKQGAISIDAGSQDQIQIGEQLYSVVDSRSALTELEGITPQIITSTDVRSSIRSAVYEYVYSDLGKSPDAAAKIANSYVTYVAGNVTEDGSGGAKGSKDNGQSQTNVKVVKNALASRFNRLPGTSTVQTTSITDASKLPQMVQQYTVPGTAEKVSRRHIFQFKPNQINYSGLGSEWTEIPRTANVPIVDWRSYKLLQVSFQFLVATDEKGTLDDLRDEKVIKSKYSVDEQLKLLRRMASAPYPVYLLGFDDILSNSIRSESSPGGRVDFVIAEFNISSLLRTEDGKINRAQCDITLREIPIESVKLIDFPTLRFGKDTAIPKKNNIDNQEGSSPLWTDTR